MSIKGKNGSGNVEVHDLRWAMDVIRASSVRVGSYPIEMIREANKIIDGEIDRVNNLNNDIKDGK